MFVSLARLFLYTVKSGWGKTLGKYNFVGHEFIIQVTVMGGYSLK